MRIQRKLTSFACLLAGIAFAAMVGCGSEGDRLPVSGKVTVDGTALAKGSIIFKPKSKDAGPQAAGKIENGEYHLDETTGLGAGNYSVMIYADQPLGFAPDEPKEFFARDDKRLPANVIPASYNTQTTLEARTVADNDNHFNFNIDTSTGN